MEQPLEGVTAAAVARLAALAHAPQRPLALADELARALALVSRCHAVPVAAGAAREIDAALDELRDLLQRQRLFGSAPADEAAALDEAQQEALGRGVRLLWAHATAHQLLAALVDLVRTVDFMPRAIAFWRKMRRHRVRAVVQRGPFEWFEPRCGRRLSRRRELGWGSRRY